MLRLWTTTCLLALVACQASAIEGEGAKTCTVQKVQINNAAIGRIGDTTATIQDKARALAGYYAAETLIIPPPPFPVTGSRAAAVGLFTALGGAGFKDLTIQSVPIGVTDPDGSDGRILDQGVLLVQLEPGSQLAMLFGTDRLRGPFSATWAPVREGSGAAQCLVVRDEFAGLAPVK